MKKYILTFLLFICFGFSQTLMAQCEAPSILWDEDGIILNWIAKDGATSHVVRYRENGTFPWTEVDVPDDTFLDISFLDNCKEYDFRVRTICGTDQSSYTPVYVAAANCGVCYKEYCEPPMKSDFSLSIVYFRFNDIINEDENPGEGYEDFRGDIDRVIRPSEEVEVELKFMESYIFGAHVDIFIDYDRNQEFEIDEHVVNIDIDPEDDLTATFENPGFNDLDFGISRMRVIVSSSYSVQGACSGSNYNSSGEVEEYCVLIGELPSACDFDFDTDLVSVSSGKASFEWEELLAAQGYNYRYKKTSEPDSEWEELATIDNNTTIDDLEDCEEYEFEIRGVCPFDTSGYKNSIIFNSFCTVDVKESDLIVEDIIAFPNPWSESLNLNILAKSGTTIQVQAYNLEGTRFELGSNIQIQTGDNTLKFENLEYMSSGVYYIEVVDAEDNRQYYKTLKIQ